MVIRGSLERLLDWGKPEPDPPIVLLAVAPDAELVCAKRPGDGVRPTMPMLHSTCNKHADVGRPYIIWRHPPGWGFWSNFSVVLEGLDEADRRQLVPVIDMERYKTRYTEEEPVHGTRNAWEYFFEQPTSLTLAEALARNPLDSGGITRRSPFTDSFARISPTPETLLRGRELLRKYVRLKPEIQHRLDALLSLTDGARCVGVHVRGTDQRRGHFPGHPVPAVPAAYLQQVVELDREHRFERIFLATDEQSAVSLFDRQFSGRLMTTPAHRTSNESAAMDFRQGYQWLFDAGERHLHKYHLGLEVLIDALLLSRCAHLVCGASNVSHAAMYFADESQRVHAVPPLWLVAGEESPSAGRAYLATLPSPTYQATTEVLEQTIEELRNLVDYLENEHAREHSYAVRIAESERNAQQSLALARDETQVLRSTVTDLQDQLIELTSQLTERTAQLAQTRASAQDDLEQARSELQEERSRALSHIRHLEASLTEREAELAAFRQRFVVRLLDRLVQLRRRLA